MNIAISPSLLEQLDENRGLIPRSAFVSKLVEDHLKDSEKKCVK